MFRVEKANLSSHFRSIKKKPPHVPQNYQLLARSFDEKVILHLKTLDLPTISSNISLSWLSAAVSFLSTVHSEAEDQISNLKSDADDYQVLYVEYSLKTPSAEKLNKAEDSLTKSLNNNTQDSAKEKSIRAKALIEELTVLLGRLPPSKSNTGRDLIRRTFFALGVQTVFIGSVLVTVLYGESDLVNLRVPVEFLWADSVNNLQTRIFDLIKPKQNSLLEIDDIASRAVVVLDLLHVFISNGGDKVHLEDGVKELGTAAKKFSDGVDTLTSGVNGLFRTVMNTRNGRLDM
ncbi:hypothetical protein LXL04_011028 [Taraxacum kok-saghyz]